VQKRRAFSRILQIRNLIILPTSINLRLIPTAHKKVKNILKYLNLESNVSGKLVVRDQREGEREGVNFCRCWLPMALHSRGFLVRIDHENKHDYEVHYYV
jgi:hypothetical protein